MSELESAPVSTQPGRLDGANVDLIADLIMGKEPEEETAEEQDETKHSNIKEPVVTEDSQDVEEDGQPDESEEAEETEEESSEEDEPTDVTWSKVLGVDDKNIVLDDKGNFAGVNVKVDGEISTVDMPTLIAGFQFNKSNTNKSKALAEERKQLDEFKQTAVGTYTTKLQEVEKLTEYLNTNLMKEFQGIDWDQLRVQNPGEYAALVQDYTLRQQELQKVYSAIAEERTLEQQKIEQENLSHKQAYLAKEVDKLISKNPNWADKTKLKQAFDEMSTFLVDEYGFEPGDFNTIYDSRVIEAIKDALAYRKGKKVADKKVAKPISKFQKSVGGGSPKKQSQLQILTAKAKNATGGQKRAAETDAIAHLLSGGQ